jgi:hypothetical protein
MSLMVAVEGSTDAPVVAKVAALAGWELASPPLVKHGKGPLDKALRGYNAAAAHSPWFVLRDMDHDAPCPGALAAELLPDPKPLMRLRIAVRAIEAWLMADPETLAVFLHISPTQIPSDPEREEDPKGTMVNLARRSTKTAIKKDMLPPPHGAGRRTGPGYEGCLLKYGEEHWRADVARGKSRSLDRAVNALLRLRQEWSVIVPIMDS